MHLFHFWLKILLAAFLLTASGCYQRSPILDTDSDNINTNDADVDTDADGDGDGDTDSDSDADGDADGDGDSDTDSDADGDADSDSDADGDADTDSDADGDADSDSDADGDADSDSDADGDADSDSDADGDADSDSDADGDSDSDSDGCGIGRSVGLSIGESEKFSANINEQKDFVSSSCDHSDLDSTDRDDYGKDQIEHIVIERAGDLAITILGEFWDEILFALYAYDPSQSTCPDIADEISCKPYIGFLYEDMYARAGGGTVVFPDVPRGEYLLVASDLWGWAEPFSYEVGLYEEVCGNGVDDNKDGKTDCADSACVGTTGCHGGTCETDVELGTLTPHELYDISIHPNSDAIDNDFDLVCTEYFFGAAGNETILAFSIDVTSDIFLKYNGDQEYLEWGFVAGILFEAGPGEDCSQNLHSCSVVWDSMANAKMTIDPLAPGNYFLVIETGNVVGYEVSDFDIQVWSTPTCTGINYWNEESAQCTPWECGVDDLGVYNGNSILVHSNTCGGTEFFYGGRDGCVENAGGKERLHKLTVPAGETISAVMAPIGTGIQGPTLYVIKSCEDYSLKTCADGSSTWNGSPLVTYTNTTDEEEVIFIAADSYQENLYNLEGYFYTYCGEYLLIVE